MESVLVFDMPRIERKDKLILPPDTFGGSVYHSRMEAGLQLIEAGRKAGFAAGEYLSLIESGRRVPQLKHVPRIAVAVKANPVELTWLWIKEHARPAWDCLHGLPDSTNEDKVSAVIGKVLL